MSKNLTKQEIKNFVREYNFHNIECARTEWSIEEAQNLLSDFYTFLHTKGMIYGVSDISEDKYRK